MGTVQPPAPIPPSVLKDFQCAVKECDQADDYDVSNAKTADERCKSLGTQKHACVHKKMKDKEPAVYSEASFDMKQKPPKMIMSVTKPGTPSVFFSAVNKMRKAYGGRYKPGKGHLRRPDACTGQGPDCHVLDAKFPCDASVAKGSATSGVMPSAPARGAMGRSQRTAYKKIAGKGTVKAISPHDCRKVSCP
jgi:hypothetical protein